MVRQWVRKYPAQIGVPIHPEHKAILEKAAARSGTSLSGYARFVLIDHVNILRKSEWLVLEELGYDPKPDGK